MSSTARRPSAHYLILLRHSGQMPAPDELEALMKKFARWIDGMKARGQFVRTDGLEFTGKVIRPGGIVTDGPYAEAKEVVGGYLVIAARSLAHATQIARRCPALAKGGTTVEVRPVARRRR